MQNYKWLKILVVTIIFLCYSSLEIFAQKEIVDSLKLELNSVDNDSIKVRVLGDLAYFYYAINSDTSYIYAKQAYDLANSINSIRGMVNGRYKMALAKMGQGNYGDAEAYANNVISLAGEMRDTFRITLGYNLLGVIQSQSGNSISAVESLFKSAELSDLTGDTINTAYAYTNIGDIYMRSHDNKNAYKYFARALEIWQTQKDSFELVTALNNLGTMAKDSLEKKNLLIEAIRIGELIEYNAGLAYAYKNFGNFLWKQELSLPDAEVYFQKALDVSRESGDQYILANNLVDFVLLKIELKKYAEANSLNLEAKQICKESGLDDQLQEAKDNQSKLDFLLGNYASAYENLRAAFTLRDSIYSDNLSQKITQANVQYEVGQKEAEIVRQELEISKQKNARNRILFISILAFLLTIGIFQWYYFKQRKKQADQLIALNNQIANAETQALRAQMNPHFIFNALNSIKLYILKKNPEKGGVYLDSFARLVRSVLQNSKEPLISLEKEFEALDLYISLEKLRFDEAFEHEIIIHPNLATDFYQVPPLILQPYVENAIWHGLMPLKMKGKLTIEAALDQEVLLINIQDNGVGRDQSSVKKLPKHTYKKSMGMDITKGRMELQKELHGMEIKVDIKDLFSTSGAVEGTKVEIRITY